MQKIIKSKINSALKHKKHLIVFSAVYIVGIIFGLFFSGAKDDSSILYVNAYNYHLLIFDVSSSVFKTFFKCFLSGALLTLTIILFGFSNYTIPLISIILFYRGLILGTSAIIFLSLTGVSGLIIFIIVTLPCNVLISAGLIISSVLNYDCNKKEFKTKLLFILKNALISLLFSAVASIYLIFLLITVIRPINTFF